MSEGALPPRDPEALLASPATRLGAHVAIGLLGGALGAALMAMDRGTEGHGHGGGGTPFAMLPHQLLLTLPLAVLLVLLLREVDGRRMATAMVLAVAGIVAVDLLLAL